jgi:hypothetical protein
MIDGVGSVPEFFADLVIGTYPSGVQLAAADTCQGRRVHDFPGQLEAIDHGVEIVGMIEKLRIDIGRGVRIGAGEAERADALRPQQADR